MQQLCEELSYKPEDRGFNSQFGIFLGINPSIFTMSLGWTQPLSVMNTRICPEE